MTLADLLVLMDSRDVSLVQLQSYRPTTGKVYAATVGWFRQGTSGPWSSSCANGATQEEALATAMKSTGLFPELGKARRRREDLLA